MARTVSKTEACVGYGIILLLVIIASVIYLQQSRFNLAILTPGVLQAERTPQTSFRTGPLPDLVQYAPMGLVSLSPAETFAPDNLSDKINGKAELYLPAGFVRLSAQRFAGNRRTRALDGDICLRHGVHQRFFCGLQSPETL